MRAPSATRLALLVYGFAEGLAHQDSGERGECGRMGDNIQPIECFGN
jgi:hypothetical protein